MGFYILDMHAFLLYVLEKERNRIGSEMKDKCGGGRWVCDCNVSMTPKMAESKEYIVKILHYQC